MQVEDLFEQCAVEAAFGLFLSYSVSLDCVDDMERAVVSNIALCGVVGFLGREISGTLLLAATDEPLASSNLFHARRRDWMAELSNQLFGRLKNRLLQRGLELAGTRPAVISGDHLVTCTGRSGCQPIVLRSPAGGRVCIWLDYVLQSALPFALSDSDPGDRIMREGEILLF